MESNVKVLCTKLLQLGRDGVGDANVVAYLYNDFLKGGIWYELFL